MTDPFSKTTRSEIMRSVKSKGNKSTEKTLISYFKESNIKGWRRNYKVIGKPDFIFLTQKIAIFTDGCFWHGHNCRNVTPKKNADYWLSKQKRNKERDNLITTQLSERGWKVIRIWECELKKSNILKEIFYPYFLK